jgi:hypothetical protein
VPPPPTNSAPGAQQPDSRAARHCALPLVPSLQRRHPQPPDATAVQLFPVPESAPPYDDDTAPSGEATAGARAAPAGRTSGGSVPAGEATAARGTAPASDTNAGGQARADDMAAASGAREGAGAWPSQFAQVLAETLAGSRSQGQIVPWTSDQARRRLRQLGPMMAAGTVPRVRRVLTTCPAAGVVEMTVVVGFGAKVRALAVRLERDGPHRPGPGREAVAARWVCTAIEAA